MSAERESENERIVPPQHSGKSSGAEISLEKKNTEEAKILFQHARQRLMNINQWEEYSGKGSAGFQLTDHNGNPLEGKPKIGNYIRINLPGPGPQKGDGYDWVRIEAIEDSLNEKTDEEIFAFRVRPVAPPGSESNDSAHFFKNAATSSFIVKREGKRVIASEIGRNEHPNTDTPKIFDKVRNAVFATAASHGAAHVQWKILMKGILGD